MTSLPTKSAKPTIVQFARDWMLIIAMVAGVAGYFIFIAIPALAPLHAAANTAVNALQPALIFCMLFLTLCRVDPRRVRLCRWHLWLLLIQGGSFALLAIIVALVDETSLKVVLEGAMLCLICPTATASAVVTRKLGGDVTHITTYLILINLLVAILVPAFVPMVHPEGTMSPIAASLLILSKVFPLLLLPLGAAILVRYLTPRLHTWLLRFPDLPFYLWAVALSLAIVVTTRSIVHSTVAVPTQLCLVAVSAVCCALQFWLGRLIGAHYHDTVTAGQALGQKNTVVVIWLGYTFFTPVTAVVGGFYSIWHNIVNTYQLRRSTSAHSSNPIL